YEAGIVPVKYRRVFCNKRGEIKFQIKGNPSVNYVLVYNMGGVCDIQGVKVKGSNGSGWIDMSRSWGANWDTPTPLVGQVLSFQVTTSDGKTVESDNLVPASW
ncbi:Expansin-A15, partial [Bienertia sinuspersici]